MKKHRKNSAFTMVEMLAVIAVMAIIVALVVPNGIYARTAGEEATVKAQGAAIEMAMANYLMNQGAAAKTTWAGWNPASANTIAQVKVILGNLKAVGAFPPNVQVDSIAAPLEGYTVTLPAALNGYVVIARTADNVQIYP